MDIEIILFFQNLRGILGNSLNDPVGNFFKINIVYFLLRASIPFIFMVIYPLTFKSNKK